MDSVEKKNRVGMIVVLCMALTVAVVFPQTICYNVGADGAPYYIYGNVTYENGTAFKSGVVTVTNLANMKSAAVSTDSDGYYQYDINGLGYSNGDNIKVNATDGTYNGENTTTVNTAYLGSECNLTLHLAGFTFNLKPGWSFITLPLNTSLERAGDIAKAVGVNCTHVGRWNTTSQLFESHKRGTDVNNFTIDDGVGYFVYVTNMSVFSIDGTEITAQTLYLKQGWNSVGWFNSTSTNAETLAQSIPNCTAISYWNTTLGRFITHPKDEDISNFMVERGKGCLVHVTSNEEWTNG